MMRSHDSSTNSLLLSDASFTSVIESESTSSRHPYNTRLSARLSKTSLASNHNITSPNNKRLVVDLSKSIIDIPHVGNGTYLAGSRRINGEHRNVQCRGDAWYELGRFFSEVDLHGKMRRPCASVPIRPCNQQPISCTEKVCRCILIFIAIGCLVLICSYMGNMFEDKDSSLHCVKKELRNIKFDMEEVKQDVQDVVNSKEQTEKKLVVIEELLRDLKKSAQRADSRKCPSKDKTNPPPDKYMRKEIIEALKIYNADKTARTDFALESAGGSILSIRNTENFPSDHTITFFGVAICYATNNARAMIQPGTLPGECWAFKGSSGSAVIQLVGRVRVTGVSLEHVDKAISPTGDISSAPNDFSIWGLAKASDIDGHRLGQFNYNKDGPSLQYFDVDICPIAVDIIEFRVHSNHGNPDFTCVYRLRVHGILESPRPR